MQENNDGVVDVIRNITQDPGTLFVGVGVNVNKSILRGNQDVENAVLPAWRDTLIDVVVTTLVYH